MAGSAALPLPASLHELPLPCGFLKALTSVTGGARTLCSPAPHCRADLQGEAVRDWAPAGRAPIGRLPPRSRSHPRRPPAPPSVTPAVQPADPAAAGAAGTAGRQICRLGPVPFSQVFFLLALHAASTQTLDTTTSVSFLPSFHINTCPRSHTHTHVMTVTHKVLHFQ